VTIAYSLPTSGNGRVMIHRSTFSGDIRRFQADAHVRTLGHNHKRTAFGDRMVAIDRMAGTTALACVAVLSIWLIGQAMQMKPLDVPSAIASSADGASDGELTAGKVMTVAAVLRLQSKLQVLGFDPGFIDGVRGGRTLDALNHYRETKDLPRVSTIEYATVADLLD
jgi:hypothetical protein